MEKKNGSTMTINSKIEIEGKMSIEIMKKELAPPNIINLLEGDEPPLIISGILSTDTYIEEINTIFTDRFILNGVIVYYESFGTEENEVIYKFIAKEFTWDD